MPVEGKQQIRSKLSSLEYLQQFVASTHEIQTIVLVKHKVSLNWSQVYKSTMQRAEAFRSAFKFLSVPIKEYLLRRNCFLELKIKDLTEDCKSDEVYSIASRVNPQHCQKLHFSLMNLHPGRNVRLDQVKSFLKYVSNNKSGALFRTDRFFHYIGRYLLNENDWFKFLGKFLIPFVFVNSGYIGYSLMRGFCCIRLNNATILKKKIPSLILEV